MVYQLFYQMVLGKSYDWAEIIKFLSQVSLGAYVSHISLSKDGSISSGYITLLFVQCRHWSCLWYSICPLARVHFQ